MKSARSVTIGLAVLLAATAAFASWYDDYDDGLKAVRNGQGAAVIQKMTAAINGNSKENDKARTYGAIFINYHPYYYRGVAYLNTGKYEQAVSDFERTSGAGPEDLGSIETLMWRAKGKLAQASTPPPPEPQPPAPQPRIVPPPVPVPVQPAAPSIDPALRQRAAAEINQAKTRLSAAMQRKAGNTPQYAQATQALTDALTRSGNARSNDELNAAIASAQNAATIADLAPAPGAPGENRGHDPRPRATPRPPRPAADGDPDATDASQRRRPRRLDTSRSRRPPKLLQRRIRRRHEEVPHPRARPAEQRLHLGFPRRLPILAVRVRS